MTYRLTVLIACMIVLAGCDQRSGILYPEEYSGQRASAEISYAVSGTYATCDISYVNRNREVVVVIATALPFNVEAFPVQIERNQSPFPASVSAVCRDETKAGKSTVSVVVNGEVKERGATAGYGAQAFANVFVDFESISQILRDD